MRKPNFFFSHQREWHALATSIHITLNATILYFFLIFTTFFEYLWNFYYSSRFSCATHTIRMHAHYKSKWIWLQLGYRIYVSYPDDSGEIASIPKVKSANVVSQSHGNFTVLSMWQRTFYQQEITIMHTFNEHMRMNGNPLNDIYTACDWQHADLSGTVLN